MTHPRRKPRAGQRPNLHQAAAVRVGARASMKLRMRSRAASGRVALVMGVGIMGRCNCTKTTAGAKARAFERSLRGAEAPLFHSFRAQAKAKADSSAVAALVCRNNKTLTG